MLQKVKHAYCTVSHIKSGTVTAPVKPVITCGRAVDKLSDIFFDRSKENNQPCTGRKRKNRYVYVCMCQLVCQGKHQLCRFYKILF